MVAAGGQRALVRQVGPWAALPTGCAPSGAGLAGGGTSPPVPVLSRCVPAGSGWLVSVPGPLTLSPLRFWDGEPWSPHPAHPSGTGLVGPGLPSRCHRAGTGLAGPGPLTLCPRRFWAGEWPPPSPGPCCCCPSAPRPSSSSAASTRSTRCAGSRVGARPPFAVFALTCLCFWVFFSTSYCFGLSPR